MRIFRETQARLLGRVATLAGAIMLSALVSLIMLPFTSRVLHASDYGTYTMLMSIVALVSSAMDGGASILMPAHYGSASVAERGRIFASTAAFAFLCAGAAGLLLVGLWFHWHAAFVQQPGHLIIAITAALMPLRALTSVSSMAFSVSGRSLGIAEQIACQAVVVFLSTLIALFGFSMEGASLYIGAGCGQLVALGVCLVTLKRHRELSLPSVHWFRQAVIIAPTTATAGFMDGARGFGESLMLSGAAGLHSVGILSHAKLYLQLLNMFAGAVSQNIWARSLQDARDPHSRFDASARAWAPVQIVIGCAGIVFVFLGRDVVELISNGKLTQAADYIPIFFMIALIQNAEQPAIAVIHASGRGAWATWFRSLLLLIALITLYPTIAFFGIKGILVVGVIECCILRVVLRGLATRERQVPFQDQIAMFGCLIIAAAMIYQHTAAPPLSAQLAAGATGIAMLAALGGRSVGRTIMALRELLTLSPGRQRAG